MRLSTMLLGFAATLAGAQCIDGKWDLAYTWVKDCTSTNPYDGQYGTGTGATVHTGETRLTVGAQTRTLSWKLHYFKANLPGAVVREKLPLVVGLHPWTDGATVPNLLNVESSLMQYEGSWEDVIFLTVALENGNNLNTWWDGSKVNGVPVTWAMDAIVDLVKSRIGDAASLLATAGASGLAAKTVDPNRVYLTGASMGGSGTYHVGIRHPEIFAAVHANAGYADYDGGPCGNENFCTSFTTTFIGTVAENLQMKGIDGKDYPARSYANMSWFVGAHNGASWTGGPGKGRRYEPPYVLMTHGKADDAVNISSANRLFNALREKKFGHTFFRHTGGHSAENFLRLHWMLGFRLDQSYPAFGNNSTDVATGTEQYNFLNKISWMPGSIKDQTNFYEIKLTGTGTVDVTPRRLQNFVVAPNQGFRYWINDATGAGKAVAADANGVLTIPGVSVAATATLIIKPDTETSPLRNVPAPSKTPKQGSIRSFDGHSLSFSTLAPGGTPARVNGLGRKIGLPAETVTAPN